MTTDGYNITDGYQTDGGYPVGVAERRLREKSQRRNAILKAAKRLISKHGVEGMSMNQLADATELNKATLYLYFTDKDDLIDAVVFEGLTALEKTFQEADRRPLSGFDRVLNLVQATFAFYKQHPVYFYTMNHQERRSVPKRMGAPLAAKGNDAAAGIFNRMGEGLRQGIDDGSVRREVNINLVLVLLYAQIYGVMHTIHSKEDVYRDVFGLDPATIERSALDTIGSYLKTGSRPKRRKR
jgi:AcrR family transcriptional regulator